MKDAKTFGLTLLGDGATIKRMPLINIIASGVYCPVAVLSIADCTNHMAKGGMKDADYIAKTLFLPQFETIDPEKKLIDLVSFDGAANVQKAGRMLCETYPKCTVIHGGEHVVSLVFGDICKLKVISNLIRINKLFYRFFTLHHTPHSMLLTESKKHNNGKSIMFIRASDTRMGGHIISLARTYRLKAVLESLVTDHNFISKKAIGKKGTKEKIISLIKSKSFWNHVLVCLKSLFPLLKLLRLCDKKEPAMDRLYYYVRQADISLIGSKKDLDDMQEEVNTCDPKMSEEYYNITVYKEDIIEGKDSDNEYEDSEDDDEEGDNPDTIEKLDSEATVYSMLNKGKTGKDLGGQIINLWMKRRRHLIHSYAITAWMLSPIPEVMSDVEKNESQEHILVVEALIDKIFHDEDTGKLKDQFWIEYNEFKEKIGNYFSRPHCWSSALLTQGRSYLWHKNYSVKCTKVLGRLACRVTSKIIGIGSAERNWGDVKHLKSGKRSHISAKTLEKQATIYGRSCVEIARISREVKNEDNVHQENLFFDDEDLAEIIKIPKEDLDNIVPRRRTFNGWKETWETSTKKKCPEIEKRLLKKYGGMKLKDADNNDIVLTINPKHCYYKDGKSPYQSDEMGWILYTMKDGDEVDDLFPQEPWELSLAIEQIIEYNDPNVEIIHRNTSTSNLSKEKGNKSKVEKGKR